MQFEKEMMSFEKRKKRGVRTPDNYIFFTNASISGVETTGTRDKLENLSKKYKHLVGNIVFFGESDLCRFLDNNREVATSYSSFILPGDILHSLFTLFNKNKKMEYELLSRYLEKEFKGDMVSRLEHAGNMTDKTINLEKVFIDLYATKDGLLNDNVIKGEYKFLKRIINIGDESHRMHSEAHIKIMENDINKFVLIGGPGYGKSTITQFLCQIHRANLLKSMSNQSISEEVISFLKDCLTSGIEEPQCIRLPIKITLKDYAGWVLKRKKEDEDKNISIVTYLKYVFEKKGDGEIGYDSIRELLSNMSLLFIFDGLDEVPITSNRRTVLEEIVTFVEIELRQRNSDAIIIATTRPQGYTREFDDTKFQHLQLADLSKDDCKMYLNKLMEMMEPSVENRENYLQLLKTALKDEVISSLMRTPLQATIMAVLVKSGGEPPRDRYNLFNEYYSTIFKREKQKGVVKVLNDYPKEVDAIHNKLGYFLQVSAEGKGTPSSSILIDEFKVFARQELEELELEKQVVENYIEEISFAIVERLVFITEVEDGRVGFNIRSLQEFFSAQFLMHNKADQYIITTLKLICGSAYWRNTFLFCVGYLYRHKDFLIDIIDSLCGELNGSSDDYDCATGKSVGKIGSWLALDILNEGTFRGVPKYENKFAKYLEELFIITACDLHANLGKVSNEIKRKYLKRFVEKYIVSPDYTSMRTSLVVSIHLLKNNFNEISEVLDNVYNDEIENQLLKIDNMSIEENWWVISKICNIIVQEKIVVIPREFRKFDFLEAIAKNHKDDKIIKKFILENSFMMVFQHFFNQESRLLKIINSILEPEFQLENEVLLNRNLIVHEYSESIHLNLVSIERVTRNSLKIADVCKMYGMVTMGYLFEFCNNPTKKNLWNLFHQLKIENNEVQLNIMSSEINWVFGKVFLNDPNLLNVEEEISNGLYGDIDDWTKYENKFKNSLLNIDDLLNEVPFKLLAYNTIFEITKVSRKEGFINFYLFYRSVNDVLRSQLHEELIIVLFFAFDTDFQTTLESLKENKMLEDIVIALKSNTNEEIDFLVNLLWSYIINNYTVYELHQHINNGIINFDNINIYEGFLPVQNQNIIQQSFEKAAQLISFTQTEGTIIRILFAMFSNLALDKTVLKLDKTNFQYLINAEYVDLANESSRLLLCFANKEITKETEISLIAKMKQFYNDAQFMDSLMRIIVNCWDDDSHAEELLVLFFKEVQLYHATNNFLILNYENAIRNLCHNYSTGIQISNLIVN